MDMWFTVAGSIDPATNKPYTMKNVAPFPSAPDDEERHGADYEEPAEVRDASLSRFSSITEASRREQSSWRIASISPCRLAYWASTTDSALQHPNGRRVPYMVGRARLSCENLTSSASVDVRTDPYASNEN